MVLGHVPEVVSRDLVQTAGPVNEAFAEDGISKPVAPDHPVVDRLVSESI